MVILEACVDSIEAAILAEQRGASRLELCANLHLDGTTPEMSLVEDVLNTVHTPVKVMIRPRGGNFVYSESEFQSMLTTVQECKNQRVDGIVTGLLLVNNTLDLKRITLLAQKADPLPVTIHKCIDLVPDIFKAIEDLKEIPGVLSILSSGQAATAWGGRDTLKQMHAICSDRISLIVAGGVTSEILPALVKNIGATEYHGRRLP